MSTENIKLTADDIEKLDIDEIKKMRNLITKKNQEIDFDSLDYDKDNLSLTEKEIKDRFSTVNNKIKFIEQLIKKIEIHNNHKDDLDFDNFFYEENEKIKCDILPLEKKDISDYTISDSMSALDDIQRRYRTLRVANKIDKIFLSGSHDTLREISNTYEANKFQDTLIENILGNKNGYNNEYIKGYDNKKGNYLIKIPEIENNLENGSYNMISDKNDPNYINSELLSNYFSYLKYNGKMTIDHLINTFSSKNMMDLYLMFKKEDTDADQSIVTIAAEYTNNSFLSSSNILRNKLIEKGIYDEIKNILNISIGKSTENNINVLNTESKINEQNIDFFLEYPENISLITEKKLLLNVIKEKSKKGKDVSIKSINNTILENYPDIILENEIQIETLDEISLIPNVLYKDNTHLETLFIKYSTITYNLLYKLVSIKKDKDIIQNLLINLNIDPGNIPQSVSMYISGEILKKDNFLISYNNIMNDTYSERDEKIVTNYIINNLGPSTDYEMIELAKKDYFGYQAAFMMMPNKSINYSKALIENQVYNLWLLDQKALNDHSIIDMLIKKDKELGDNKVMLDYFDIASIKNINSLMYIFSSYYEINNLKEDDVNSHISMMLLNNKVRHKVLGAFQGSNIVNPKYSKLYETLENIIGTNLKSLFNQINEIGEGVSNIIKTSNENVKLKNDNKNLLNEAFLETIKGVGIDNIEIHNIEKIVSDFSKGNEFYFEEGFKKLDKLITNPKKLEIVMEKLQSIIKGKLSQEREEKGINEISNIFTVGASLALNNSSTAVATAALEMKNIKIGGLHINQIEKEKNDKVNKDIYKIISNYIEENSVNSSNEKDFNKILKIITDKYPNIKNDQIKSKLLDFISKEVKRINDEKIYLDDFQRVADNTNEYRDFIKNPDKKGSFKNYLQKIKPEYKTPLEKKENTINSINTIESRNYSYYNSLIEDIPINTGENTKIKLKKGGEVTINSKEYNTIFGNKNGSKIKNPEALKNLIDFKEKMEVLKLDFIWKNRNTLIPAIKNTDGFKTMELDNGTDLINPEELNNILKFVLTVIGEKPDNDEHSNYSKIINISGDGILNNKTDFNTGYKTIGRTFFELGYIGESSIDTKNIENIHNYKKILKQKKS